MPSKRVSLKGKGADLFFGPDQPSPAPVAETTEQTPVDQEAQVTPQDQPAAPAASLPLEPRSRRANRVRESTNHQRDMSSEDSASADSGQASYRASKLASTDADGETIDGIRKVVKEAGREVSFVRLSPTEKSRLADIVYTYKRQGVKTSENEINRIAINVLLSDYETNGEQSMLAKVLSSLQA